LAYLEENADDNVKYFFKNTHTHPILMHLTYLFTCCCNFRFLLCILIVVNWSSVFCMFGIALTRHH